MNPLFKMHLHMLRAIAISVITAIDLVLLEAEPAPAASDTPPAKDENKVYDADPLKCGHPRSHWRAAPAMGRVDRVLCMCGEEVEA